MNETELRGAARTRQDVRGLPRPATVAATPPISRPAIANAQFLSVASDRYLETAIVSGRAGTTMSAWSGGRGGPLGFRDVKAVVAYLRSFEAGPAAVVDDKPSKGDPARGAAVFFDRCRSCHGDKGATGPYVRIGGGDLLGSAGNGMLRATIRDGRPGTLMPSFQPRARRRRHRRRRRRPPPVAEPGGDPSAGRRRAAAPLPLGPVPLNPRALSPSASVPSPRPRPPTRSSTSSIAARGWRSSTRARRPTT